MKGLNLRLAFSALVLLVALAYTLPSIPGVSQSPLGAWLPSSKISLGLDLQGGISLTLGVDMEKAVASHMQFYGQSIRDIAAEKKISILRPTVNAQNNLEVILAKDDQAQALEELFATQYLELQVLESASGASGGKVYQLGLTTAAKNNVESMTLDQVVRTIRNRIDQFGVAEPDIRTQAGNQVQVQLPGMADAQRAIQIVGQTAHLEFHLVRDDVPPNSMILPTGTAYFPQVSKGGVDNNSTILLDKQSLMTGEDIIDARPQFGDGVPYVALSFNSRGAANFERITGDNTRRFMAIVLDGKVYSAPRIENRIAGGKASITGNFTVEEAQDLALILRAGSLPAPVTVLEERTVGPSLGQESIDSGILAALVGAGGVIVLMPLYYAMSGLMANLMLCFTMTLVMAGMAALGATLTLPGIAGIVLTIGMAVDANVLIYERIREELAKGLSALEAVEAGFSRASISITDSNLTTIIAAGILYQFGTGPVRGFAVTLTLGIVASMFTAIFVSKALFQLWMKWNGGKSISI